mgnify:CR=1 FL=1
MIFNSRIHPLPEADCGYEYKAIKTKDGVVYWTDTADPSHLELLEELLGGGNITINQYDCCGAVIYNDFSPRHNSYIDDWVRKIQQHAKMHLDRWKCIYDKRPRHHQ